MSNSNCRGCDEDAPLIDMGLMPAKIYSEDYGKNLWVDLSMCTECGAVNVNEVSDEDIKEMTEMYVNELVKHDLISEEEAEEYL